MNSTMLVIVIVVVAALVIIGLIAAFASRRGRGLRPLPDESRDRFARSWHGTETRFIEDPRGAVQEADQIVVMILGERGATIHDEKSTPKELRMAREAAAADEGRQGTEGMRQAMVHYKAIVDDAVGGDRMRRDEGRREVAS
jgi:hypothetical protein